MEKKVVIEAKNLKKYYWLFEKDYQIIPWILTKKHNNEVKKVLDNLNFKIYSGETVGIIGKNGTGKSTLMKLIAGISFPSSGEINVTGSIGSLINLAAGFDGENTGRENIYNKAIMMGYSEEYIDSIFNDIIEFADIGEYIDLPMKTYSSGMRARVGFALAVFSDPDVLIIDEVMAVGDKNFKEKSLSKTKEMFTQGKTIIFASHSETLIEEFCERVIFLQNGKIIYDGDVEEGLRIYNERS